jgi:ribosomal protein L32
MSKINKPHDHISQVLSVTADEDLTKIVWRNGGTPLEWSAKRAAIESRFTEKSCYDLLDYSKLSAAELLLPTLPEVTLALVVLSPAERDSAVTDLINAKLTMIDEETTASIAAVRALILSLSAMEKRVADAGSKQADRRYSALNQRESMRSMIDGQQREIKEEIYKHEKKLADVTSVFNSCFSSGVLQPFTKLLVARQFRQLWREMDVKFDGKVGGEQSIQTAIDTISSYRYDINHTYDENFAFFDTQCQQLFAYNGSYTEEQRKTYWLRAIKDSGAHFDMKTTCTYLENSGADWAAVRLALSNKYINLLSKGKFKKGRETAHTADASTAQGKGKAKKAKAAAAAVAVATAAAAQSQVIATAVSHALKAAGFAAPSALGKRGRDDRVCDECGKIGHTKDTCWQIKNCPVCGMKGHPDWLCPDNPEAKGSKKPNLNLGDTYRKLPKR